MKRNASIFYTVRKTKDVYKRQILDLAEVNPNIIVAVFAGAAIDMSAWIGCVSALIYALSLIHI